jgi:hypothetical protein
VRSFEGRSAAFFRYNRSQQYVRTAVQTTECRLVGASLHG